MILILSAGIYILGILLILFSRRYLTKQYSGTIAENVLQLGVVVSAFALLLPIVLHNVPEHQAMVTLAISIPVLYLAVVLVRKYTATSALKS